MHIAAAQARDGEHVGVNTPTETNGPLGAGGGVRRTPGCWYVQDSRMLQDLDEHTVEQMVQRSTMATFDTGEFLHQAGEPMDAVSFLSEGRAKVYRVSADGKQQTIVLLGPGDAFGEIGIVDPSGQDLYVEALSRVVVCRTTRRAFLQLAGRDPALAVRLAEAMGEKLQFAREQIADFAFRDIRGRVAHLLLTFLERERRLRGDASIDRIVPGLTHRELAELIGTRRESVTVALNELERDALIRVEGKEIVLADIEAVRAIAAA
jgi:CRP/FNR family cyclic AMP-dependent transcriptional regulator